MFLSDKDDVDDIVQGLDEGADDYMVKPFRFPELMARVRAMVRNHFQCSGCIHTISTEKD